MRYLVLINMRIEKARIQVPQQNNWIDLIECNTDNDFDFMFHIEIIFSQECFRACYPRDLKIAWNKHQMDLSFDNIDSYHLWFDIIPGSIQHDKWRANNQESPANQNLGCQNANESSSYQTASQGFIKM